jgi:trehalose-6-phosphate synthase
MRRRPVRHSERLRSNQSGFSRPPHGRLIVVANRAPVSHKRTSDGQIVATHSASGLVTALDPLVTTHAGTWVAHGAGDADRLVVDVDDAILCRQLMCLERQPRRRRFRSLLDSVCVARRG